MSLMCIGLSEMLTDFDNSGLSEELTEFDVYLCEVLSEIDVYWFE